MKKEFIQKIKHLFNVELVDEPIGKPKRFIIYCKITSNQVLSYLAINKIRYESHMKNYYWVYIK